MWKIMVASVVFLTPQKWLFWGLPYTPTRNRLVHPSIGGCLGIFRAVLGQVDSYCSNGLMQVPIKTVVLHVFPKFWTEFLEEKMMRAMYSFQNFSRIFFVSRSQNHVFSVLENFGGCRLFINTSKKDVMFSYIFMALMIFPNLQGDFNEIWVWVYSITYLRPWPSI